MPSLPLRGASRLATAAATASAIVAALAPQRADAGLSVDEFLARHQDLMSARAHPQAAARLFRPSEAMPDGLLAAAGGLADPAPALLRPMLPGDGGLQWTQRGGTAGGLQWRAGLGWRQVDGRDVSFDGSELSLPLGPGRVYASVERRHWGPSWTGGMILDAAAPAIPSVGWRKTDTTAFDSRWLSWIGPWQADVFFGGLSGHAQPRHPKLVGMRLQATPLPGLELGVSRTIQWGGEGRPESLGTLWDAFRGHDNPLDASGVPNEPGNQLGGFDLRYTLHTDAGPSYSVYAQAIGEDSGGWVPTKYLSSIGLDTAFAWRGGTARLFVEGASTVAWGFRSKSAPGVAYRHHIYLSGYTEQGRPIGHPAGGDVKMASVGALVDAGALQGLLMLHKGRAQDKAQFHAPGGSLTGLGAVLAWRLDERWRVGAQLDAWREPQVDRRRGQLWVQYSP